LSDDVPAGGQARLTKLVKNAGCASKIPPADLQRVLSRLPAITDPRLLVGSATADDAGVFQTSADLCLVQTVDVFTPSVDDPYTFGRIAACNSLSDVYAMGGKPITALSIIGYPINTLGDDWMYQMIKGGMDALQEAEVILVGGHSINDEEIKFGFAVTGVIDPKAVITNSGAQPGDVLILTKPIGTGVIAFAAQMGRAGEEAQRAAAASMTTLNRAASEVMVKMGAHACTDVTGFGLLGHLYQMVRESRVGAEIWWNSIPLLEGAADYASNGMVSGAAERNREYAAEIVEAADDVPEYALDILYDPQTSGGLLFSVPGETLDEVLAGLSAAGCAEAAVIGRISDDSRGRILVTSDPTQTNRSHPKVESQQTQPAESSDSEAQQEPCCEGQVRPETGDVSAESAFQRFMSTALGPGALDVIQKELTTIALSVAIQCEPCLKLHLKKALSMGITTEEIQEAAWMGVAFGGCKAMMFWNEQSKSLETISSEAASNK
nr:selenide, water dikinase SelD [Armatimonadota bacterium]NIO96491.1 selenide, water dikinase SelD [Armatimonadota bacterium]